MATSDTDPSSHGTKKMASEPIEIMRRDDRIEQALRFLSDPRTQTAPQKEKEDFLRRKGLNDDEIRAAFSRYDSVSRKDVPPFQPVYVRPAFMDEPILWSAIKSIFSALGAVALGVVGHQAYLGGHEVKDEQNTIASEGQDTSQEFLVSEDRLQEILREFTAKQELRHKEILLTLRDLTNRIENVSRGRKPGGSIVVSQANETQSSESAEAVHDDANSSSPLMQTMTPEEISFALSESVKNGSDTSLLLILQSIDSNRKLNKSNPRFKKLGDSPLLRFVGFEDRGDFFELTMDNLDTARTKARELVSELKKTRDAGRFVENESREDEPKTHVDQQDPWVINSM
jgi:hypothetical protein